MPYKRIIPRVCTYCGKDFLAPWNRPDQEHCSPRCRGLRMRLPEAERFWPKVDKGIGAPHWLWTAAMYKNGYGKFSRSPDDLSAATVYLYAHREAWELATGIPIPDPLEALHTCDVRACVRNDDVGVYVLAGREFPRRGHLWLGSHDDNMLDMRLKGRSRVGERNHMTILCAETVLAMRQRFAHGDLTIKATAALFGVEQPNAWQILRGHTWKHLL